MKAYMFPGQGSQKKGMGEELFQEFNDYVKVADEILGYSIKEICLNDSDNQLKQTQFTQPVLYTVNALTYFKHRQKYGEPDFLIGHSLGEYNALLAADVYSFETGLKIVKKRGELMSTITGGGMAAVVGLSKLEIQEIISAHNLLEIDIANLNTPMQTVIAGPKEDINHAKTIFEGSGAKLYMPLNVSGPFHSRYMKDIQEAFKKYVDKFIYNSPRIPVISNFNAQPYQASNIKDNIINQLTSPVQWDQSLQYLIDKGIADFSEIGPGNVLTGLLTKIRKESTEIKIVKEESVTDSLLKPAREESKSSLGSEEFYEDYNVDYPYVVGSMQKGISSPIFVAKLAQNGFLSFLGTGSLSIREAESLILETKRLVTEGQAFGCHLQADIYNPQMEDDMINLFLRNNIKSIEAAGFWEISLPLLKYRAKGLSRTSDGTIQIKNKILIKLHRMEIIQEYLETPPQQLIDKLLEQKQITYEESIMLQQIPMVDDICVMGDSGGDTSQTNTNLLLPAAIRLRDESPMGEFMSKRVRIGAGGGIGTPESAAVAFSLGADFILTGSINQCTVESGTSDMAKNILQKVDIHDLAYIPSTHSLDTRGKTQVVKKGVFFPARANKLYELLKQYNSISDIESNTKKMIEEKYLGESMESILNKENLTTDNPKSAMHTILNYFLKNTVKLAIHGEPKQKVNFNIYCGPALGAFNRWVRGTDIENWKNRNVDVISRKLVMETEKLLGSSPKSLITNQG